MKKRRLRVIYILSSKYDDEGYVLRFVRGSVASNTLCCLKTLTEDLAQKRELGDDVEVSVDIYDDTIQRIPIKKIARVSRRRNTQVVVGLVGVQSNQFPRASDLALKLREHGVQVMIGGFHVSGVLATFDKPSPELQQLLDKGVTLVKGEVEGPGVLAGILRDALERKLKPIYDNKTPPDISHAPIPKPDKKYLRLFNANMAALDTSRGCPLNCSFCTVIRVQGRKMRARSPECILKQISDNHAEGIYSYFFTDDNFFRSPIWEAVFDGLIEMRARRMGISFMMQVDCLAYRNARFVEKAAQAGCFMVFTGIESVNRDNLEAAGKRQNDPAKYADMVEAWHRVHVTVFAGYVIGFPFDTYDSVRRDIAFLSNSLKLDKVSFFMLTPLPGSDDYCELMKAGAPLDADLNNYDSLHETFRHPRMAPGEWKAAHVAAAEVFYNTENIVNILLRTPRERYWRLFWLLIWYRFCALSKLHPMFTGLIRLKDRKGRRPIFPRENVLRYAWRRMREMSRELKTYVDLFFEFQEIWLLSRKPDDPRWALLADIRDKWAEVRLRILEYDLGGRYDAAAAEVRAVLANAAAGIRQASETSGAFPRHVGRRLRRIAGEAETYLRSFELQKPTWQQVLNAQRFVNEKLVARYEEIAIRYVAQRRRFNAYRKELIQRLKTGRILTLNIAPLPRALLFELIVGLRFGLTFLSTRSMG